MTTVQISANKIALASALATGAILLAATPTPGAVAPCPAQYGAVAPYGGQPCPGVGAIQINKEVFNSNPKVNKFVDNVVPGGNEGHTFAPGDEVTFKLRIKNIGNEVLAKVQVKDTLPSFLEPVSGEFSFEITDLKVDQTVEKELKARVVSIDRLPKDQTQICDFNIAEAISGDKKDQDKAQVCAEKKAAKELPKAGPVDFLPVVLGSSLLGFLGTKLFALRPIKRV